MTRVRSMTGYARVTGELPDGSATWALSIKSVNHRFLDLQLRLPSGVDTLEMDLRRILKEKVCRGHLDLTLTYEPSAAEAISGCDKELVARYLAAFRDAQHEYGLKQEPDLNAILRLPGIFKTSPTAIRRDQAMEALCAAVLERLPAAINALNTMRETEGAALSGVLMDALDHLERDVEEASALRTRIQPAHFNRLQKRMTELLEGTIERDRLLQEAAMLAQRSDVEEELARLRMHIDHFRLLLNTGGEAGKKLDFLLQEMNREANTLLSKSAGMGEDGSRLTVLGLAMKSEIEKAKEQVQNLE